MEVQIKLLRALQEREFERVGGSETLQVDVRVISATNRDLETMIDTGGFREDLYYRLNVFPIHLPALRERIDDLPVLVDHFIGKFARATGKRVIGCTGGALERLSSYSWPGNVRELENIIERAMILVKGELVEATDLAFARRTATQADAAPRSVGGNGGSKPLAERLLDEERREIIAAVEKSRSNIAGAARLLGINRSTLYYRMRKHGLEHLLPTKVVGTGRGADDEPAPAAGVAESDA
jgi:DNA-binding NtrC family response regulator